MGSDDLKECSGRDVARLLALLESERQYYREILVSMPVGAAMVSREARIVLANLAFRNIVQLRFDEIHRKRLDEVIPSRELQSCVEETLTHGTAHSGVPIELSGRDYRSSTLRIRGSSDETGYEALIVLKEVPRGIKANSSPDLAQFPALLWTMHPYTMHFESVDGDVRYLLGYSPQHWLSTPDFWLERIHADDRAGIAEFYRWALQHSGEFACEFRAVRADRSITWQRDSFRVVKTGGSGATRISGITVDVDERRRSEQDNVIANRLEALVGLSRLLSHDLNNCLMIITGYAEELLAHLPENDQRRLDLQAILSGADTMAGITGELHGFTRNQAAAPGPINIAALLAPVAARIREQLGATLVVRLPHSGLMALADPAQLEAVLLAIARRLRNKTDPHMVIATRDIWITELANLSHALKPGRCIEIALRGPYTADFSDSSFEAFLSGKDSHGSDMARAYAIVREWGGTIISGRADHLSEVRVLLPTIPTGEPAAGEPKAGMAVEPAESTAAVVLLVEDQESIRKLLRKILTREGYKVLEASSAEEALEVARQHPGSIHLLLSDMKLAGVEGRELAEAVGRRYPDLRVLLMSGYTGNVEPARSAMPGVAFLQKPFTLAALVTKVREVLAEAA